MKKIGIGIVTCKRPEFYKKLIESIDFSKIDHSITVNDTPAKQAETIGKYIEGYGIKYPDNMWIHLNKTSKGVCKSKNMLLHELANERECDHIFIIEDDMLITDNNVWDKYIEASKKTGIHHFMFGYHGPANKGNVSKGKPQPRKVVEYSDDLKIALNQNCVGSFCYYTKECLDKVGLLDEDFNRNNFEHVEHTYRLAKAGYTTPYWNFADIWPSYEYIDEQACSEENTSIHRGDNWREAIMWSANLFKEKHGYMPAWQGCVPDTPFEQIKEFLKQKAVR